LKGVGRVYQQTVIDTYAKVAFAKLGACPWARQSRDPGDRKTPITAAEVLNDRVVPFYDEHGIRLCRVLTDRGTEFCGRESREYELYLAVEDIDHTRTTAKSPQTNGICERFHRPVLDEFYRVAFRKRSIARSTSCRPTSMRGSPNTTSSGRIRAAGASARRRCRPFLTRFPWRRRN
jgi:transposase InsO family protein